jgi:1-deoxy-D-xylulose-5-phosphate reductoisomerase
MADTVKRLAVLGSTGSIGQQTLDIVRAFPDRFRVVALAARSNTSLLSKQIAEFRPAVVYHEGTLARDGIERLSPVEMARLPDIDMVVVALSGDAGLAPTLAAVTAGKKVALANKESLVAAGEIITAAAERGGARIMPVDSEHSAIWQCLTGESCPPSRLILTASGGPFRHFSLEQMGLVTPAQALNHPSWRMGKKVTVDSATLMNKGFEVIEAHWLFGMPIDRIIVLVHPQSIIHSMVEFDDGTTKAQLGVPDMRLPIQYALSYPERLPNPGLPRLDWSLVRELTLEEPDGAAFPCLRLAIEAGKKGGTYPAVLSAADECAVELFLARRIGFTDIARLVEDALASHHPVNDIELGDIVAAAAWARQRVVDSVSGARL